MKFFFVFSALLLSRNSFAQNILQNMQTAAAIDITAPISDRNSEDNKLELRSAEVVFFGPLDPSFDGTLNFAAHNEEGEFHAEVHEAFLSTSKLIPSTRVKAGKFFLGIGRLNQFHQHDWSFISAPRVQKEFFDAEGVADSGVEFSTLLPTDTFWEITAGVTNGYNYGHSHDAGHKPQVPTHYIHPVNFVDFGDSGALQWGFNYLGRTDHLAEKTQLYGLDFVFKKTSGKTLDFLFQSEIWYRNKSAPGASNTEEVGTYFYPQWAIHEQLQAGVRLDLFSELSRRFVSDNSAQKNLNYAVVPTLTFKNSEFTFFRVAYTRDTATYQGESDQTDQILEFQLIAILGAHPAHSF